MSDHRMKGDENERLQRLAALDKTLLSEDGGPLYNRLIFATSPYLLQHAENPTDWYEWGEEAFRKARSEDKPVFLSIGYATCHWCHVMAHESFEDVETAEVLNRFFIAVKVDREERPDIDDQYMAVAQIISGSGGWPLTIMMTPDKKPFFAPTYIPRERRMGMPGLIELLERVSAFWQYERDKVEENCTAIMASLERQKGGEAVKAGPELEEKAYGQVVSMYDPEFGGFGQAPKFPMPHYISFLLRKAEGGKGEDAVGPVKKTLAMMRRGGIYDQIGFGIHRYSTDRQWLVPHFEKMLYDQALVAVASAETYQATDEDFFREMTAEILNNAIVEMTSPDGGFCSGLDADTEGEEGKYYVWSPAEVMEILGRDAGELFCRLFHITERGNFEGRSIPHLQESVESFATREGLEPRRLKEDSAKWRAVLLTVREKRTHPLKDTKVITGWNGLMIAALAKGYGIGGDESYLRAAERTLSFIKRNLQREDGRLLRSYHLGRSNIPAFLEDYSFLIWGLVELYQVSLNPALLIEATALSREMIRLFGAEDGGFYDTGIDGEEILTRGKNAYDGAIPSGNSVAAMNLLRLGRMAGDGALEEAGGRTIDAFTGNALQQPAAYLHMITAHDYRHRDPVEITLVGPRGDAGLKEMLSVLHRFFIPGLTLVHRETDEDPSWKLPAGSRSAAFVCARRRCLPPVTDGNRLDKLLKELL